MIDMTNMTNKHIYRHDKHDVERQRLNIYIHQHIDTQVCTHAHAHACTNTHQDIDTQICTHAHAHAYTNTHMSCVCVYVCSGETHMYVSTYRHTHLYIFNTCVYISMSTSWYVYGVATISRLLKIIGFFCKRALYTRWYSAKETYNYKEPTSRSHPISTYGHTKYQDIDTHLDMYSHLVPLHV